MVLVHQKAKRAIQVSEKSACSKEQQIRKRYSSCIWIY